MINRKALWISILLVMAMIAAALWRLSLLPDWHHMPFEGPGSRLMPPFVLFVPPLAVLFMIALIFAANWKFGPEQTSPKEAVQSWWRYQSLALVFVAGMAALAQAFNIAHSLGTLQSIDRLTFAHVIFVLCGIFMMMFGNSLPKWPWLAERFRLPCNGTEIDASKASSYSPLGCSLQWGCRCCLSKWFFP